ncbi:MAG: hypothetical protein V4614_00715 [Pseudomonadota bacterium]
MLMNALRWIVNFLCATVISFVFLYLVISLAILFFIATGSLTPGQPMYMDSTTPPVGSILMFQLSACVVLGCCFLVRKRFGQKNDFRFLRKN